MQRFEPVALWEARRNVQMQNLQMQSPITARSPRTVLEEVEEDARSLP